VIGTRNPVPVLAYIPPKIVDIDLFVIEFAGPSLPLPLLLPPTPPTEKMVFDQALVGVAAVRPDYWRTLL
jgi:hypothetical protein